jgi:hypothetical protein
VSPLVRPVSAKLKSAFLECHAEGHQWRHQGMVGAPDWMPPLGMQGAIARHSVCTSCGSQRARWYTRSGEVINRYKPAEGYYHQRQAPDDYAPTRLEYRKQLVVTLFDQLDARDETATKRKRKAAAS